VLFQARLHPEQRSDELSAAGAAALHVALRDVLRLAVEAEADDAQYPPDWIFHARWTGKKASSVGGRPLAFITVGGRTSAFVPSLQKLEGAGDGGGRKGGSAAGGSGGGQATEATAVAEPKPKAAGGRRKAAAPSPSVSSSSSGGEEAAAAAPPPAKRGKATARKVAARGAVSVRARAAAARQR
jgi:formamidopyrimidine-DNA glycosylase